jgi:hypothetical protein
MYNLIDISNNLFIYQDDFNNLFKEGESINTTFNIIKNKDNTYFVQLANGDYLYIDQNNNLNSSPNSYPFIIVENGNILSFYNSDKSKYLTINNDILVFANEGIPIQLRKLSASNNQKIWLLTSQPLSNKLKTDYYSTICDNETNSWDCFKESKVEANCVAAPCNENDISLGEIKCPSKITTVEGYTTLKSGYTLYILIFISLIFILYYNK